MKRRFGNSKRTVRALERLAALCYDLAKPKKECLYRFTVFTNSPTGTKTGGGPGALLMEIHEGWQTGRVYLNLTEYLAQKTEPTNDTVEISVAS